MSSQATYISGFVFGVVVGAGLVIAFCFLAVTIYDARQRWHRDRVGQKRLEWAENALKKRRKEDNIIPIDRGPKGAA